ncbi:hypothetical protein O4220_15900 [Rhodococcus ruber]|uniref:SWIM-type domain-containing protein n=1 Tax=Rhodococcus ruber TaxID=1830 RepID=A0ABT4MG81_9NOCA|nr:hypothetical protein [Rhodococcus ruber]MCZ4519997.1 hypothetical protein [Rhodococcus ruber]
MSFSSALPATDGDRTLVELARQTIDSSTDAGPDEDGIHTMGAAVRVADGRTFAGLRCPCSKDRQIFADLCPLMRVIIDSPDGPTAFSPANSSPPDKTIARSNADPRYRGRTVVRHRRKALR